MILKKQYFLNFLNMLLRTNYKISHVLTKVFQFFPVPWEGLDRGPEAKNVSTAFNFIPYILRLLLLIKK